MRYCSFILVFFLPAVAMSRVWQLQQSDLLLLHRGALEEARLSFQAGENAWSPAVRKLIADAADVMKMKPVSVMEKQQIPPSGDKHDYMSIAPYWWPDTTKPGGVPYIRRDGEVNPEYRHYGDHERLEAMVNHIQILALAFFLSGRETYAADGILRLTRWFLDPSTRMNPRLNFAQAIRGVNNGRGIGIIETYSFRHLIDAVTLLRQSEQWTAETDRGVTSWFAEYLCWLQDSPNGQDEAGQKNNHGTAYDVQVSCIALFVGNASIAQQILSQAAATRIASQIEPDGSQPLELERTKSWSYATMNLNGLVELAQLGKRVGVDLWGFRTSDGRSIRKAIDYLLPFALGNKQWPWTQIVPFKGERMHYALRIAAATYDDMSYLFAAHLVSNADVHTARSVFSLPPLPVE